MPLDDTYRISEARTVMTGHKAPHSVQAWKKTGSIAPAGRLDVNALLHHGSETQEIQKTTIARNLSRVMTADTLPGSQGYSFEQALRETVPDQEQTSLSALSPSATQTPTAWTFDDVIDVVNPLQHIPLINMAYRGITGDHIGAIGQIVGGALYGGPVGAVAGTINAMVQETTGKDIAGNVLGVVVDSFN
jgi:hypothetical protein